LAVDTQIYDVIKNQLRHGKVLLPYNQKKDQILRADLVSKIVSEVAKHTAHIESSIQHLGTGVNDLEALFLL
jgi:hypothetical protein